jgi:hypothetical protein
VAIDGVDAAGKTTLADELAAVHEQGGVLLLRASIDGLHQPASVRHLRAEEQPARSYHEDSFDCRALRRFLLDPVGASGDHMVRTRVLRLPHKPARAIRFPMEPGRGLFSGSPKARNSFAKMTVVSCSCLRAGCIRVPRRGRIGGRVRSRSAGVSQTGRHLPGHHMDGLLRVEYRSRAVFGIGVFVDYELSPTAKRRCVLPIDFDHLKHSPESRPPQRRPAVASNCDRRAGVPEPLSMGQYWRRPFDRASGARFVRAPLLQE